MKTFLYLVIIVLIVLTGLPAVNPPVFAGPPPVLVWDHYSENPRGYDTFRLEQDPFVRKDTPAAPRDGLDLVRASGSSQFSEKGLVEIKSRIPARQLVVVDLREESHGFVDGRAVFWLGLHNWANQGMSQQEALADERRRLDELRRLGKATVAVETSAKVEEGRPVVVRSVATEEEICRAHGVDYLRLAVTDLSAPKPDRVDRFVELVRKLPADGWVHLHCKAGLGRTSVFLQMYDMMKNAKRLSPEDVNRRQYLLGGHDLLVLPPRARFNHEASVARAEFLRRFHEYCRSNSDGFATTWSSWLSAHKQDRK
ncbi:MAG: phosphatase [Candidatus Riflebacteria bacterium]|nr:phosphatase [Candidatus Riflebacteria bacterium]